MNNNTYLQMGKMFFAIAVFAIGVVHLVTGNFPTGLLPVTAVYPGKIILVYANGAALIVAGILILTKKYAYYGASLAGFVWFIWLLGFHLPHLISTYNQAFEWTPTFEVGALLSGALLLMGNMNASLNRRLKLISVARYIFALGLVVFCALHIIYAGFIATLISAWIPWKLFWAYFVGFAFLAVAISIFIHRYVRLSASLIGLMFLIWFFILHLPRVIAKVHVEPEWTSMFVVLGFSGVAFLIASTTFNKPNYG